MQNDDKRKRIDEIKKQIRDLKSELCDLKESVSNYYICETYDNFGDTNYVKIYVLGHMTELEAERICNRVRDGFLIPLSKEKYKKYEEWLRIAGALRSLTYVNGYFCGLQEYAEHSMQREPKTDIDKVQRELERLRDIVTKDVIGRKVSECWDNINIYGWDAIKVYDEDDE